MKQLISIVAFLLGCSALIWSYVVWPSVVSPPLHRLGYFPTAVLCLNGIGLLFLANRLYPARRR